MQKSVNICEIVKKIMSWCAWLSFGIYCSYVKRSYPFFFLIHTGVFHGEQGVIRIAE